MIRQRNIDPNSYVGIEELERIGVVLGATTQRFGTPVANAQKIQLVDLVLSNDLAVTGGGTLGITINRTDGAAVGPNLGTAEVLIATVVAADAGGLGSRRFDLSNIAPINGQVYSAAGLINLMVKIIGTGVFTTGGPAAFKLRYRPYLIGKDA